MRCCAKVNAIDFKDLVARQQPAIFSDHSFREDVLYHNAQLEEASGNERR
jgi:hypothetical protein